jgi:hypothetical protein
MVAEDAVNLSEDEDFDGRPEAAHLSVPTPLPLQASAVVEPAVSQSVGLDVCSPA